MNIGLEVWLSFAVLAAIISMIGSLLGVILKDFFFTRSIEKWKLQQSFNQIYLKFRDPLFLTANELASRVSEIIDHYPPVYLKSSVLNLKPKKQIANTIDDEYFQLYKLNSTIYRLSAFLAWLELYRQEITFLHPGNIIRANKLESAVEKIRSDLGDGQINTAEDWFDWRDTLIFREELRAIGESLIEEQINSRIVIGYGRYCECLESESINKVKRWAPVVQNFFLDLKNDGKDFRKIRICRVLLHVIDLMRLLDRESIDVSLQKTYDNLKR